MAQSTKLLHVGRPNCGDTAALFTRLSDILESRIFSNGGPQVEEFESALASRLGVRHAITVCNATVGLEIAYRALNLKGEVIVPSYTFVATAHALHWLGIKPVFADIDPETMLLDPRSVEASITPQTTGIVGVHLWGRPCDTDALGAIAERHGLRLVYDAAHAFGASRGGRVLGGFGDCEVFSFHATKFLNSFEGGAITTNNDELAERLRRMRTFGFCGYDNVIDEGTNGKMTEICAAMGLVSLASMDDFIALNRRNYEAYRRSLEGLAGLSLIDYSPCDQPNYQYIVVTLDPQKSPVGRDALVEELHQHGVMARKYFWPGCHNMEPYRTLHPEAGRKLPRTVEVAANALVLPTGQAVDEAIISEKICGIIAKHWGR